MLTQILPGLIMFAITVAFVTFAFIPVTTFKQKNDLVRFYWVGVWIFIALIAAFAGAAETLKLFDYDVGNTAVILLGSLTLCFILFVAFAWLRLSSAALVAAVSYLVDKRKKA